MGSDHSTQKHVNNFNPQQWQQVSRSNDGAIYANRNNQSNVVEEHPIAIADQKQLELAEELYQLRSNDPELVSANYFNLKKEEHMCSRSYSGDLYTENIPIRLSNIVHVPFPDVLHLYNQAFNGFHRLSRKLGYFKVNQECIGINDNHVAKVWHSPNFAELEPHFKADSEQDMVHNIATLIQSNSDMNSMPRQEPSFTKFLYSDSNSVGFGQAKKKLELYANYFNRGIIPKYLSCVERAGGAQAIKNKWQLTNSTANFGNNRQNSNANFENSQYAASQSVVPNLVASNAVSQAVVPNLVTSNVQYNQTGFQNGAPLNDTRNVYSPNIRADSWSNNVASSDLVGQGPSKMSNYSQKTYTFAETPKLYQTQTFAPRAQSKFEAQPVSEYISQRSAVFYSPPAQVLTSNRSGSIINSRISYPSQPANNFVQYNQRVVPSQIRAVSGAGQPANIQNRLNTVIEPNKVILNAPQPIRAQGAPTPAPFVANASTNFTQPSTIANRVFVQSNQNYSVPAANTHSLQAANQQQVVAPQPIRSVNAQPQTQPQTQSQTQLQTQSQTQLQVQQAPVVSQVQQQSSKNISTSQAPNATITQPQQISSPSRVDGQLVGGSTKNIVVSQTQLTAIPTAIQVAQSPSKIAMFEQPVRQAAENLPLQPSKPSQNQIPLPAVLVANPIFNSQSAIQQTRQISQTNIQPAPSNSQAVASATSISGVSGAVVSSGLKPGASRFATVATTVIANNRQLKQDGQAAVQQNQAAQSSSQFVQSPTTTKNNVNAEQIGFNVQSPVSQQGQFNTNSQAFVNDALMWQYQQNAAQVAASPALQSQGIQSPANTRNQAQFGLAISPSGEQSTKVQSSNNINLPLQSPEESKKQSNNWQADLNQANSASSRFKADMSPSSYSPSRNVAQGLDLKLNLKSPNESGIQAVGSSISEIQGKQSKFMEEKGFSEVKDQSISTSTRNFYNNYQDSSSTNIDWQNPFLQYGSSRFAKDKDNFTNAVSNETGYLLKNKEQVQSSEKNEVVSKTPKYDQTYDNTYAFGSYKNDTNNSQYTNLFQKYSSGSGQKNYDYNFESNYGKQTASFGKSSSNTVNANGGYSFANGGDYDYSAGYTYKKSEQAQNALESPSYVNRYEFDENAFKKNLDAGKDFTGNYSFESKSQYREYKNGQLVSGYKVTETDSSAAGYNKKQQDLVTGQISSQAGSAAIGYEINAEGSAKQQSKNSRNIQSLGSASLSEMARNLPTLNSNQRQDYQSVGQFGKRVTSTAINKFDTNADLKQSVMEEDNYNVAWDPQILADLQANVHRS